MSSNKSAELIYDDQEKSYFCIGTWSIFTVSDLKKEPENNHHLPEKTVSIDGKQLKYFDSSGALTLMNIAKQLEQKNKKVEFINFSKQHHSLIDLVQSKAKVINYSIPPQEKETILYKIGKETVHKTGQAQGFVILLGELSCKILDALRHWRKFRLPSVASNMESAGIQALPIVALLSFLIGVVLAYQMGLQLQTYGANIFIAYLSGMAILREFAPLITAIIVAGRTSSAFTAQIGSMKVNEEVDAIQTMGLSTTELLVMPKVIGLLLMFPLLIFWADFFSLIGAMFMSKWMLDVGYYDFLARLKESVGFKQLMLGLYKAPAFAIIISLVGCYQGFLVQSNADSIGSQTTKSVVQALFLIIVADALFSIIYSWMGL